MKPAAGLARQHARLLAVAFVVVELIAATALAIFLILPLARRSADDLAGLMMLSAQTWAELPPATRPAFEHELLTSHQLALRAELPGAGHDEWHPPFYYLLETALVQRSGNVQHLVRENVHGTLWYWAALPTGDGELAVGIAATRIASQPAFAALVALLGALALAWGVAVWSARRIAAPLAQLEAAAIRVGQGELPALLPESGPAELAALARRFNAMAQQVRALLAARTTLLAGISHDLRTPLARMRLALEMLRDTPTPALLARLDADIDEMNALIAQLLELARGMQCGGLREAPAATDLAAWLTALGEDFSTPQRRIDVCCVAASCRLAPHALRRALGNLLQNALRHAPVGTIELRGECVTDGCTISVLDHGPGIPTERIPAMFEPFARLDASRSPQGGGSGLGLAIVRELARANGWQVTLANRDGGGLAARIFIPSEE